MTQIPHAIGLATAFAALTWAVQPAEGPPKRAHHAVVYDSAAKRGLMMGGSTPTDGGRSSVTFDDMWAFNGARWRRVPVEGERLSSMRVVFDPDRRWLLSLGGYD